MQWKKQAYDGGRTIHAGVNQIIGHIDLKAITLRCSFRELVHETT